MGAEDARKEVEDVLKEDEEPSLKLRAVSAAPPALTVTTNSMGLEMGLDTLVGSYAEKVINHSKKFYQKISGMVMQPHVFLFYWDRRDGAEWDGWWFGDQFGGNNCWARSSTYVVTQTTPPRSGWKIRCSNPVLQSEWSLCSQISAVAIENANDAPEPVHSGSTFERRGPVCCIYCLLSLTEQTAI